MTSNIIRIDKWVGKKIVDLTTTINHSLEVTGDIPEDDSYVRLTRYHCLMDRLGAPYDADDVLGILEEVNSLH